jgi:hypothetical protein
LDWDVPCFAVGVSDSSVVSSVDVYGKPERARVGKLYKNWRRLFLHCSGTDEWFCGSRTMRLFLDDNEGLKYVQGSDKDLNSPSFRRQSWQCHVQRR